jgi:hypothetical protein
VGWTGGVAAEREGEELRAHVVSQDLRGGATIGGRRERVGFGGWGRGA